MSRRAAAWPAWLAWSSCAYSLLVFTLAFVLLARNVAPDVFFGYLINGLLAAPFLVVGAPVAARRPDNPIGWLFCAAAVLAATSALADQYGMYALVTTPGALPGGLAVAWISSWLRHPVQGLLVFLLLLFPNGRLASPRWRIVAWLAAGAIALFTLAVAFAPGPLSWVPSVPNPLGVERAATFVLPARGAGAALLFGTGIAAAASVLSRFRRAHGEERQQLKWFAYAGALMLVLIGVNTALGYNNTIRLRDPVPALRLVSFVMWGLTFAALPIAIGLAMLRYRLYDVDVVIHRTLVYGALTASLGLAYWGGVLVLQALLRPLTQGSELAVAGSTLAVAALFQPLRRRIQDAVDRRFYRRRYDAAKTLEAFSAQLRQELDLDSLHAEIVGVVRETMQPAHVSLWLRPPAERHAP